jgi:hypothetical protein
MFGAQESPFSPSDDFCSPFETGVVGAHRKFLVGVRARRVSPVVPNGEDVLVSGAAGVYPGLVKM